MAWADRPKEYRYSAIGGIIGAVIAAVIAFVFASTSGTIVRYLIMAAGFCIGYFGGRWLGSR